jgi:VCBS repeat-containing protein
MENKYQVYRDIRFKRTYRTIGKMSAWRIVLGVILIIFVLLLSLTLLVMGVRVSDIFGSAEEGRACRVEYQIRFTAVDEAYAEAIAQGNMPYDADTKTGMGSVTAAVQVTPSVTVTSVDSATNQKKLVEVLGKVDIVVTVMVDAMYEEGVGYTVNGRALRIGNAYTLRFPNYVGNGICVRLDEVGATE